MIGKVEKYRGGDRSYRIGDVIDFSLYGNSSRYKGKGWKENPNIRYSDIAAFEADMNLYIVNGMEKEGCIFTIRAHPLLSILNMPYKSLSLFANGIKVGNWIFDKDVFKDVSCKISKDILHDNQLHLLFIVEVPESFAHDKNVDANAMFAIDKVQLVYQ